MRAPQRLMLMGRRPGPRRFSFLNNALPPGVTLTRASTGWYFDSGGVLQSAANDVPRFNHNPTTFALEGLLNEPARTSVVRNSTVGGAVAGSPGTLPTNWLRGGNLDTLTQTVSATVTEDGLACLVVRLAGTPSISSFVQYEFEARTQIAALVGQQWAASQFVRLADGSLANVTVSQLLMEWSSGGVLLASTVSTITPGVGAIRSQRTTQLRTLTSALTAYVNSGVRIAYTADQPVDLTVQVGLPQPERGSGASSPIKTTSAAVTRAADVLSLALPDGTYDVDITRLSGVTNVAGAVVTGGSYTVPTGLSPLQSVVARRVA